MTRRKTNPRCDNCCFSTFAENCRNLKGRSIKYGRNKRTTSKYKGVHWHKKCKKWAAAITFNNKTHHLGYFTDEIEAARAYDKAAKKYHGKFASLNLPTADYMDSGE